MKFMNQFNDQLPFASFSRVNWLELRTGISKVRVQILASLVVFNCDDLLYIYTEQQPNKYVIAKTLQCLKVSSVRIRGNNPEGKKILQQTKQKTGTKQIKNVQRKRKYSRSSRKRPPRKFETVAVTRAGRLRE